MKKKSLTVLAIVALTSICYWSVSSIINNNETMRIISQGQYEKQLYFTKSEYLSENIKAEMERLSQKFVGKELGQFLITDYEDKQEIDVSSVEGVKIIEIISPYCQTCTMNITSLQSFHENNPDIPVFRVTTDNASSGIRSLKGNLELGEDERFYYIDGEIPSAAAGSNSAGVPYFIVVNEDNTIAQLAIGEVEDNGGYMEMFWSIKKYLS